MHSESWQLLSIALSVLSIALQIAGITSPRWIWLDNGDDHVGLGLFYRVGLDAADGDVIPTVMANVVTDSDKTMDTDHWLAVGILEIISGALVIFLIPLIVFHYRLYKADNNSTIYCIRVILILLAALSWMTNAAGLLVFIIYHGDILTNGPDVSSKSFSWSGLMCAVALLVNVAIHYIVVSRFDDTFIAIPAGADPNINQFPSTETGLMSRYYQADAHTAHNKVAKASIDGLENGEPPMFNSPNGHINTNYIHDNDRRLSALSQQQVNPAMFQNDRVVTNTEFRTVGGGGAVNYREQGSVFSNPAKQTDGYQPFSYYQGISGNQPGRKDTGLVGRAVTTSLHRTENDSPYFGNGGRYDQEFVFTRDDVDQTHLKRELVQETEFVRNVRKQSGDFLVTAKHGMDRDPHRKQLKYMSHTKGPDGEEDNREQRLVLSPVNFTEGNVKYNPSYMYRPYSEQTY